MEEISSIGIITTMNNSPQIASLSAAESLKDGSIVFLERKNYDNSPTILPKIHNYCSNSYNVSPEGKNSMAFMKFNLKMEPDSFLMDIPPTN